MKTTVTITKEEFKLIKSFAPDFSRKEGIQSNEFIIGWSELMPVVERIDIDHYTTIMRTEDLNECYIYKQTFSYKRTQDDIICHSGFCKTKIEAVYKALVEFIKCLNLQSNEIS